MGLFVTFFTFFFLITVQAQDVVYTDASFKASPLEHAQKLNQFFSEEGFLTLAQDEYGIPSLGINQVYSKTDDQFVMVKYGMKGEFPLQKLIQTPEGFLFHDKVGENNFFLYFRGMNENAIQLLLSRMKNKISFYRLPFKSLIISEAHADEDCGSPEFIPQMMDFSNVSANAAWNFARNCASGLGAGAWGQTGGAIEAKAKNFWEAVSNPIETADRVGQKVLAFQTGLSNFVKGLITNPRGTMNRIGAQVGGAWNSMVQVVTTMPVDLKIQFACSFIGAIGIDAAIALFTAGVATGKIAITLASLAKRFALVGKVFGVLSKISNVARASVGITEEKMKTLMNRLMKGDLPDADLRHLDDLSTVDKDLSMRTLACYI